MSSKLQMGVHKTTTRASMSRPVYGVRIDPSPELIAHRVSIPSIWVCQRHSPAHTGSRTDIPTPCRQPTHRLTHRPQDIDPMSPPPSHTHTHTHRLTYRYTLLVSRTHHRHNVPGPCVATTHQPTPVTHHQHRDPMSPTHTPAGTPTSDPMLPTHTPPDTG
jgi:hypothetical protein